MANDTLKQIERMRYKAIMAAKDSGNLDEYIDGVSKTAMETGKRKPYAVCYGGMCVTTSYENQLRREH